jgi:hypothetical protein
MVRLLILAGVMFPVMTAVLLAARVPDAVAASGAVRRRLFRIGDPTPPPDSQLPHQPPGVTYPESGKSAQRAAISTGKGPELSDQPPGTPAAGPPGDATAKIPHQFADDFQPDVPGGPSAGGPGAAGRREIRTGLSLGPGATVASGRYRLLVFHGGPDGLQCWQALDTALDRQVALTFVDPDRRLSDRQIEEILARTQQLSRLERPGLARVLDATTVSNGSGLIVAEWIRGGSLKEVAGTSPSALGGARAIQSLAAVADEAHRAGVALSVDHPSRIRVSIDGDVALAFPATLAGVIISGLIGLRFGTIPAMAIALVLAAVSNIGFAFLALSGGDRGVWIAASMFEGSSAGMATAAMVAWASRLTNPVATAAQFALLSSLMTLVAGFLGGFAGMAVEALQVRSGSPMGGFATWFSVTPFAAIPPLILIWLVSKRTKPV